MVLRRKLISSSSFHSLDMTLAVAEALNPNKRSSIAHLPTHVCNHDFLIPFYVILCFQITCLDQGTYKLVQASNSPNICQRTMYVHYGLINKHNNNKPILRVLLYVYSCLQSKPNCLSSKLQFQFVLFAA